MSPESVDLLLRKQRLQLRIERQRHDLRDLLAQVESAADGVDAARGLLDGLLQGLRRHKLALAIAGAFLLAWRPVGMLRWVRRAWFAYAAASRMRTSGRSFLATFRRSTVPRAKASKF